MDKESAISLLKALAPAYHMVEDLWAKCLGIKQDGKFAEADPYKRLVISQAVDSMGRLWRMLLKEEWLPEPGDEA